MSEHKCGWRNEIYTFDSFTDQSPIGSARIGEGVFSTGLHKHVGNPWERDEDRLFHSARSPDDEERKIDVRDCFRQQHRLRLSEATRVLNASVRNEEEVDE